MIDEQWAREHVGTAPSVGGCGASYHDERGDVQDCTSVEPCRACLRRRIEQLEAQRGGAAGVPELTAGDIEARLDSTFGALKGEPENEQAVEWTFKDSRWAYNLAVSRIQPIPADRVLAEGMVGVDREEWEVTSALALRLANWYNGHEINRTIWPPELQRYRTIHSLRSAKGEVVG